METFSFVWKLSVDIRNQGDIMAAKFTEKVSQQSQQTWKIVAHDGTGVIQQSNKRKVV
jgi:hypothetical protein